MGYKAYGGDKMSSPLTQKHKSKKHWVDEDRNLTMAEVLQSKDTAAHKDYLAKSGALADDTSLSGDQKRARNEQLFQNYKNVSQTGQSASIDSMGRAISADLAQFNQGYDFNKKSQDQYDADLLDFEKKGRWTIDRSKKK